MSDTKQPAIIVKNISKSFKLPHEKQSSIKGAFVNVFNRKRTYEKQQVLKNISFEVQKGEFFGIVGRNGSGKSTLLKLLSGIYSPDKGEIAINGSLVPFIELGVGFNPELTGRENVYLNGALLGFSRKEMSQMYNEIVEFAELEKFMDQKLKNYSSGMQVRLAFSIAIRAQSDILVLDEVLAVGDEAFQRKCFQYFAQLKRENKTVILVTHSMDYVHKFCSRAMLIDKGKETELGTPLKITQIYSKLNDDDDITVNQEDNKQDASTKYVSVRTKHTLANGKLGIEIHTNPKKPINDPVLALGIYRDTGEQVYRWTTDEKIPFEINWQNQNKLYIELDDIFPVGKFTVNLYLRKRDRTMDYAVFNAIVRFEVKNSSQYKNATFWKIPEKVTLNDRAIKNV